MATTAVSTITNYTPTYAIGQVVSSLTPNERIHVCIDSGAALSFVSRSYAEEHFPMDQAIDQPAYHFNQGIEPLVSYQHIYVTLKLTGVNPVVSAIPIKMFIVEKSNTSIIVGTDWLHPIRAVINLYRGYLTFETQPNAVYPLRWTRERPNRPVPLEGSIE